MKLANSLDANQNSVKNASFEVLASDPATGLFTGRLIYNSTEKVLKWYDSTGSAWRSTVASVAASSTPSLTVNTANGSVTISIADANGTNSGLMPAAMYTKLNSSTASNTVSTLVQRDASGNFAAGTITATVVTGLADPVNATDATNKQYVDNAIAGLAWKDAAHLGSSANVNIAAGGVGTVAGVAQGAHTIVAGDRILLKDQATPAENGLYVAAAGAWSRALDADTSSEILGMAVLIQEGTLQNTQWILITDAPITLGSTSLTFTQFGGGGATYTAGDGLTGTTTFTVVGTANRISVSAAGVDISAAYVGQTSITTLGTITTGTWSASTIAANKGGTGQTTFAIGDILYADTTSTLARLADVATGNALISGGTGTAPAWGKIGLTTHVSGTLPIANGGTNLTSVTNNGVVVGSAGAYSFTAAATANQVFRADGSGVPGFGTIALGSSAAVTGTLAVGNGGTGATTASGARTGLVVPTYYTVAVPSGSTSAAIAHNLNTTNVLVEVYEQSGGATVLCDVTRTNANTVTLTFSVAPTVNQYTVTIIGVGV
jgi:hypothetical protein